MYGYIFLVFYDFCFMVVHIVNYLLNILTYSVAYYHLQLTSVVRLWK